MVPTSAGVTEKMTVILGRPIVERIQAGDRAAENELADGLKRRVFVVLLSRISDPETARELTQDVLMAVLDAIRAGRVHDPDRLGAFVHGVARNIANNHLRSRSQAPIWVELTEEAVWADAQEEMEMADRRRVLQEAFRKLDDTDRRILTLSVIQGCSAQEVSDATGLSAEAVRARKSRALRGLTDRVQKGLSRFGQLRPLG